MTTESRTLLYFATAVLKALNDLIQSDSRSGQRWVLGCVLALLTACAEKGVQTHSVQPASEIFLKNSMARTEKEYRQEGARHLYEMQSPRIFKGQLPPLLYAVAVVRVRIDAQGQLQEIDWMRQPKHAPEVVAEIERILRSAAPFPAPVVLGQVTYTETWLWDQSGFFQLDTLTQGQR